MSGLEPLSWVIYSASLIALAGISFFEKSDQHYVFLGLIAFAVVAATIGLILRMFLDAKIAERLESIEDRMVNHILFLENNSLDESANKKNLNLA